MKFQITGFRMEAAALLDHLQSISKEETSCTLVTSLGERVEVKFFLIAKYFYILIFSGPILLAGCHQPIFGVSAFPGKTSSQAPLL